MKRKTITSILSVFAIVSALCFLTICRPAPAVSPLPAGEGGGEIASTLTPASPPPTATKPAKPTRKSSA